MNTPKYELQNFLNAIYEVPEKATTLSVIQLKELLIYLRSEMSNRIGLVNQILIINDQYNYPEDYKGKELEYWLERTSQHGFNYYGLELIKGIIKNALNDKIHYRINYNKDVFKDAKSQQFFEFVVKELHKKQELNNANISYIFRILKDKSFHKREDLDYTITGTAIGFAEFYNSFVSRNLEGSYRIRVSGKNAIIKSFDSIGKHDLKETLFNELILHFKKRA